MTGEISAGANITSFTTEPGTRLAVRREPVPSLKLATNSAMAQRMEEDIDADCGGILEHREMPAERRRRSSN